MSNHDTGARMTDEIRRRIENPDWDLRMAGNVLEKKRRTRKKILFSTFAGSFAAAASLVAVLFINVSNHAASDMYISFISGQVNSTYGSIFGRSTATTSSTYGDETAARDDLDEMITETLAMR